MNILKKGHHYLVLIALFAAIPAEAYVGPGLGAGTLGVILGLLGSIIIAIFAFFWYPIKRMYKKWTGSSSDSVEEDDETEAAEEKS